MNRIDHVVVAVPVRDEEALLPACLDALDVAVDELRRARADVRVTVVVALDGCVDGSARVAAARSVELATLEGAGVGAARDTAVTHGLARLGSPAEDTTWVACTDADSVVPPGWLVRQVLWAEQGADLVIGTVEPVGAVPGEALSAWHARHTLVEGHGHVHGANLGVRADLWRQVGGFGLLAVGEDVGLVARVRGVTDRWVATDTTRVLTSGRARSRVHSGFAGYLRELGAETG